MATLARRQFLIQSMAGLAATALSSTAFAQATEDEVAELILEALEADVEGLIGSRASSSRQRSELLARIATWTDFKTPADAKWPAWEKSLEFIPDLQPVPSDNTVDVSAGLVRDAAKRFGYPLPSNGKLLVGIRGAQLLDSDAAGQWQTASRLVRAVPDHRTLRCTVGVVDLDTNKVALFPGSTVPEFAHIRTNLLSIGGCNTKVLGAYRFRVGLHGASKKYKQPGALLQNSEIVVLRTTRLATYDVADANCYWDRLTSTENLHSAVFSDGGGKVPYYSSAGCQIVRGHYDKASGWTPQGDWAKFRIAAGLAPLSSPNTSLQTADDGKTFDYFLFGFYDLQAEHGGRFGSRKYARYGSTGPNARALEQEIGIEPQGRITAASLTKWLEIQQDARIQEHPVALVT